MRQKLLQISSVGKLERVCYHLFRWKSCIWIKYVGIKTYISRTNSIKFHWDPSIDLGENFFPIYKYAIIYETPHPVCYALSYLIKNNYGLGAIINLILLP